MATFRTAVITINPDDPGDREILALASRDMPFSLGGAWWEVTSARQLRSGAVVLTCKAAKPAARREMV